MGKNIKQLLSRLDNWLVQNTKRCVKWSVILLIALLGIQATMASNLDPIKGRVTDENGQPLIGVSIVFKEGKGVTTNENGEFIVNVKQGTTLTISYIGYESQKVSASGNLNIKLKASSTKLGDVVVTALGIKKEAKALGYAVSKIDSSRILSTGTPANALMALYGAAAGVQVSATAAGLTGGMKINIRNAISFDPNSTTRPLIVVDGIPIHDQNTKMGYDATDRDNGTGLNDINPDDIESIDLLKGAKASVLYGYEGANGVLLITTKNGHKGKGLNVNASFTTTWDRVAFLPELQSEYGSGSSPSNTKNDAQGFYIDTNGKRALPPASAGAAAFGPKFDPNVKVLWWDGVERPWVAQTKNIYNDLYTTGHQNVTNVALSGGNEQGQIRFSYTNLTMPTIREGAEYKKNTFSLNASYKLNDYINLKYTGNFYFSENTNAPNLNTMNGEGLRAEIGAYSSDINVGLLKSYLVTPDGYNYFADPSRKNLISNGSQSVVGMLWDQSENNNTFTRLHNIQSITADVKINKMFSATLLGGMDYSSERSVYKGKKLDPTLIGPNSGFRFTDETNIYKTTYGQGLLNFKNKINTDFDLTGFVGGAIKKNSLEGKGANADGILVAPNFFSFSNLPIGVKPDYYYRNGEDILYSLLASAQLEWKNQVYLELQGRNDWVSILYDGYNSYFYPGISATWILSQSFDLPRIFDFSKLRVAWADVGRPGPRYFGNVNYTVSESSGGTVLTPPSDLPVTDVNGNPSLKPERKREYEFGLETYLMKNKRIGVDFSYYRSTCYNQIMAVAAPAGTGVNNFRMNAASVSARGFELLLKFKPVVSKDFNWDVNLTLANSKSYVDKIDGKLQSIALWNNFGAVNAVARVGKEYGQLYLTKSTYTYDKPGDPNNGKRVVNSSGTSYDYKSQEKLVGKINPDLTGGFYTSFGYKNFRLIANIDFQFGATVLSGAETYMMAAGVLKESLKYRDAAHGGAAYYLDGSGNKIAGNNPNSGGVTFHDGVILDGVTADGKTNTKVVSAENYYYDSYFSNGFFPEDRIFKSDYIALRNIAIEYTLDSKITRKVYLNNVVVSLFANNVMYIYKAAPNTIPESTNGTSWSDGSAGTTALPSLRSIGASIKVKF